MLNSCLIAMDKKQCTKTMDKIMTKSSIKKLLLAYDSFSEAFADVSEMCRYLGKLPTNYEIYQSTSKR